MMKRIVLHVTLTVLVAAGAVGCDVNPSVEVPEDPAPMPTTGPETATTGATVAEPDD